MTTKRPHPVIISLYVLSVSALLVSAAASQSKSAVLSHPLTIEAASVRSATLEPRAFVSLPETLRVLAAMVEFQEDNTQSTTGDGTFDLSDSIASALDAAPHDRKYFERHLEFANNYFRKCSDGKMIVKGTVLDNVYRLPYQMRHYSPSRTSTTYAELGSLMQDAWHAVDSVTPGIPYAQYDAFILFHAGVGRDIDLSSSCTGFDPTPYDIPSLYLNHASLKKIFGDSYPGVPVNNGSYFLTNTIILPETESHDLGCQLIRLSINGLLVASIGSHLGLPDLFDTKTGRTGIGRFGLMDGASIFSWDGIFPPELSAWEKYYLGWIQPITISSGNDVHAFPAVSLASQSDSVYRVLISDREYFLVENRNRDANRDGITATMIVADSIVTRTWYRDRVRFNANNTDSLVGVVTDIDEFDWSLPGATDLSTGEFFDGGIVIWHIDENIIDATIAADAINANPGLRGIDIEEGDGSQDIGIERQGILGPFVDSGNHFDFWYDGNASTPRKQLNAFTPTSFPDSRSNDRANSHIYIKEFSARGPHMTARIQVGDEQITPIVGFPKSLGPDSIARSITIDNQSNIITASRSDIFAWKSDGSRLLPTGDASGVIAHATATCLDGFQGKVAAFGANEPTGIVAVETRCTTISVPDGSILDAWMLSDTNNDMLADTLFGKGVKYQIATTPPVLSDSLIGVGFAGGTVRFLTHAGQFVSQFVYFAGDDVVGLSLWDHHDIFLEVRKGGTIALVNASGRLNARQFGKTLGSSAVAGEISSLGTKHVVVASIDGYVYLLDDSLRVVPGFPVVTNGEIVNSPALADIDGDGRKDIIVCSGNKIYAINSAGVILDNFPVTTPTVKTILTSPIVADLNGDGLADIVGVTQEGLVVAYDKSGKMLNGFPLQSGINGGSTPAAFRFPLLGRGGAGIGLTVASDDGYLYAWQTGTLEPLPNDAIPDWLAPWPQYMHDAQNTGLSDTVLQIHTPISGFFPAERAYNWPNPVGRENNYRTHIRYFVGTNAKVHIKIFDIAGDLVTELQGDATGGIDNEVEWDVSNIQSGIYLAHVDAEGTGGSGSAIIKIAVVK